LIVIDECLEGLSGLFSIFPKGVIITTPRKEGLSGETDFNLISKIKDRYNHSCFFLITADKERGKNSKDFKPSKYEAVIRFTGKANQLSMERKEIVLKWLLDGNEKKLESCLGVETELNKDQYRKTYKTGYSTKWRSISI
tara:strand:- start:1021 stop:1440 length:420 start_codon:yes stop_codon:yes gene_type:complete